MAKFNKNYPKDETDLWYEVKKSQHIVKDRICLRCQKKFTSSHKFNRLCSTCREYNRAQGDDPKYEYFV